MPKRFSNPKAQMQCQKYKMRSSEDFGIERNTTARISFFQHRKKATAASPASVPVKFWINHVEEWHLRTSTTHCLLFVYVLCVYSF